MAHVIAWTDAALDDIDGIAQYIGRDSPVQARRVVEAFFVLGDAIADAPRVGRFVPELGEDTIRERFLYSYRVIYQIGPQRLEVLAVIHGKRLLLAQIADRLEP